ncbi:MAG TPA: LysR substrate-binding domain-containing protein, partial [Dermatophilaceae bacterium]|nr:LysR substrate-binding domain-containing protein [Dermatophilaceae bacterium]
SLLSGGRVDLEFTARRPRNPSVTWQRLFTEPLGLAVPRGHRLADAAAVGLADVANEDFVMLRPPWALRATVDQLCAAAGFEPRVALEADDLPTVRGFVGAGLGVALVPTMTSGSVEAGAKVLARERGDGVVILPVTDAGASRDVGLAWSTQRRLLPSAELFRRFALVESARVGR